MSPSDASVEVVHQPVDDTKKQPSASENADVDVERETGEISEKQVNDTLKQHAHDEDEAMQAVDEMNGDLVEVDEQTSKRLLRTIDNHLMPIMCMVYAMNYLDSMGTLGRIIKKKFKSTNHPTRNYHVIRLCYGN